MVLVISFTTQINIIIVFKFPIYIQVGVICTEQYIHTLPYSPSNLKRSTMYSKKPRESLKIIFPYFTLYFHYVARIPIIFIHSIQKQFRLIMFRKYNIYIYTTLSLLFLRQGTSKPLRRFRAVKLKYKYQKWMTITGNNSYKINILYHTLFEV